ncbi:MAG TPA: L,D-transpeptidase family protein [Phycisphaerales bacterium]|nr:L,D-transpeptidase family protein [Phycisphaerales bacterium]
MALPSQSPRVASAGRAVVRTHRRRGFRMPPLAIAGVILVAGTAATWYFTRGDEGRSPLAPESAEAAADHVLDDPFDRPGAQPAPDRRSSSAHRGSNAGDADSPPALTLRKPAADDPPVVISQADRQQAEIPGGSPAGGPPTLGSPTGLGESLGGGSGQGIATEPISPPPAPSELSRVTTAADQRLAANDPVGARSILSRALGDERLSEGDRSQLRARLTELNQDLLFSSKVVAGDPMVETYAIGSGDRLSTLPAKLGLATDWRLIQRVNGISDPNRIQLGQKLKLVRGPFHAVVHKNDYRLDLYAGAPEDEGAWMYVRSFRVGLGEDNSTPTGSFIVKRDSKLVNPHWVNPRTGEKFDKDDPKNPIGERWIGIDGLGEDAIKTGYGIHGTIDPGSIGQQKSMGCVRMVDADVELVYELLVEGISRVRIVD